MKKPKLPDLSETASFYEDNTQRPRLRSAGLDHFPNRRPRTGLRIVMAVLFFAALLVILALLGCESHLPR